MKKILFISLCIFLYTSCASSQNAAIQKEAEKKVKDLKPILNLTAEQVTKMQKAEADFLMQETKIRNSVNYNKQLQLYKEQRNNEIKKILDYDQYLKYDAIEENRIKKVPIKV